MHECVRECLSMYAGGGKSVCDLMCSVCLCVCLFLCTCVFIRMRVSMCV